MNNSLSAQQLLPVTLSAVAYQLGAPEPLENLVEDNTQALEKLKAGGEFAYYLTAAQTSAYHLARQSIEKTLNTCDLSPEEIDTVIFATDSFKSVKETMGFFAVLSRELGFTRAYPISVSMSECANFHVALDMACNAIRAGGAANILLVTVDKADLASPQTRLVGGGIAVMSDAAASCIVSASIREGLTIEGVRKAIAPQLVSGGLPGPAELMLRIEQNEGVCKPLLSLPAFTDEGLSADALKAVLPSNISLAALCAFVAECGIKRPQIYTENYRRLGHCLSSDCLINLHDYIVSRGAAGNDLFLLYGAGPATLGGALLKATGYLDAV